MTELERILAGFVETATAEIGVKEVPGKGSNPRILEYHATCSLKATEDETSWCSAFVNWVVTYNNMLGTNNAAARSWLRWGESTVFVPGCIAVLKRGDLPWQGHVGFCLEEKKETVQLRGGNQNDAVNVMSFDKYSVLGYRVPKL